MAYLLGAEHELVPETSSNPNPTPGQTDSGDLAHVGGSDAKELYRVSAFGLAVCLRRLLARQTFDFHTSNWR